jgi:hypothetical protein
MSVLVESPYAKSDEWRANMSLIMRDSRNGMWTGDKVGYHAIHEWVKRRKPKPIFCEVCHLKPPYDLVNISGGYRRDVEDYRWLCRSCHMVSDGRLEELQLANQRWRDSSEAMK